MSPRLYDFVCTGTSPLLMHNSGYGNWFLKPDSEDEAGVYELFGEWQPKEQRNHEHNFFGMLKPTIPRNSEERNVVEVWNSCDIPPWMTAEWQLRCALHSSVIDGVSCIAMPAAHIQAALRYAGSQIEMKSARLDPSDKVSLRLRHPRTYKKLASHGISIDGPNMDEYCSFEVERPYKGSVYRHDADCSDFQQPTPNFQSISTDEVDAISIDLPWKEQHRLYREIGIGVMTKVAGLGSDDGLAPLSVRVRPRFETWRIRGRLKVTHELITDDVLQHLLNLAGEAGLGDWRPSNPISPGPFGEFSFDLQPVPQLV